MTATTITSTDASGQDADRALDAALSLPENKSTFQVVAREHFNPTDISVSAQIAHIKASNAQVLIAWTTGTPVGTVFRGVTEGGLDIPVVTTNGNGSTPGHPGCHCLGDQPLIGADAYGFYVSTNEYPFFSDGFNGTQLYALSNRALANGTATGGQSRRSKRSSPSTGVFAFPLTSKLSKPGMATR